MKFEIMKGRDAAEALRKLAREIENIDHIPMPKTEPWAPDWQIGAAGMLSYLIDIFTLSEQQSLSIGEILIILNSIKSDREIFTINLIDLFE
jgi:hypothetical protein